MTARGRIRHSIDLLIDPVTPEKRRLLGVRWNALPDAARTPTQGFGRQGLGCGATIGVQPSCDFSCTGCYLGVDANSVPPLPVKEIFAQLRELRAWLGPKSNVQITDGEVTLRDEDELVSIVGYARSLGMIPMIMTHGDSFRVKPRLLERLVRDAGLSEVSFHVDTTQRGRRDQRPVSSEVALMPLRDEFANMVREVRRKTARRLRAAMTLTVTRDNLSGVAAVTRWVILNHDAISLVSFQPAARVGRTRHDVVGVSPDELWKEIAHATAEFDAPIDGPRPLDFGHPDCSHYSPFLALSRPGCKAPRLMQVVRNDPDDIRLVERYLSLGSIGATFRDDSPVEMIGRAIGVIRLEPRFFLGTARRWISRRIRELSGRTLLSFLAQLLSGRATLRTVTIASHHFMSAAELATPEGKERLSACVFRVPVGGRMVSMCEVNAAGVRDAFYDEVRPDIRARTVAGG